MIEILRHGVSFYTGLKELQCPECKSNKIRLILADYQFLKEKPHHGHFIFQCEDCYCDFRICNDLK